MPLQRQGSITIPMLLCRKTVDEVWMEIHRDQKLTLGEMMLEDFLIKAGVVREGYDQVVALLPHALPSLILWPML
uniref:BZIP transcription factor 46-like n=1 Tax=Elaeis guineensis var. tenera TaxID=51953 RepID=A0A6I9Q970_ELAGV|nr:bZIP transcription factor 46-like [Elaeis guineensis]